MKIEKITKDYLAECLFRRIGLPKTKCAELVDLFFETILQGLKEDKKVSIMHFGTFKLWTKKPRLGRNLNTMEPVIIKSRKVITFKMHPQVRQAMNANIKQIDRVCAQL